MKKQVLFLVVTALVSLLPSALFAQSTQGTDFWVTLMRGDRGADGEEDGYSTLSLTFSAKKATKVYIANSYTQYFDTVDVGDNSIKQLILNDHASSCYVTDEDEETPSNHALHVTSDEPISLIAANYKNKSFDVASILPTNSLMSEYRIQCYNPSAHVEDRDEKKGKEGYRIPHGTQFAIVAAEDNVVVDITPTANTKGGKPKDQTFTTDTLKKGQVYYVWSGGGQKCPGIDGECEGEGEDYDFTGTIVKAQHNKKIAVFNGNSHTNIPYRERDRDHIYSQAMPINYWGKRFAITSSLTTIDNQKDKIKNGEPNPEYKKLDDYWERIDKVRILALKDSTKVYVDGNLKYTFDFKSNSKRFYEFDFGAQDDMTHYDQPSGIDYFEGSNHFIETSCPCAVHLFMTSNQYDHGKKEIDGTEYKYCNGDPSEIWVNPIEQKIDTLTFGTFETKQVTDHFLNIVVPKEHGGAIMLDDEDISDKFAELNGNNNYLFARIPGILNGTHTLTCDSGFIAHVYGFGQRESYGYPAGGLTKDLTAYITINGEIYRPDGENKPICGGDDNKVVFGTELNYKYDSIYWNFGDGKDTLTLPDSETLTYYYDHAGIYEGAYALIYRHFGEEDECFMDLSAYDSIAFVANVGRFKVELKDQHMPECTKKGDEVDFEIYLINEAKIPLNSDSVKFSFTQTAIDDGFTNDGISYRGDTVLIVHLPATAKEGVEYGLHLHIGSQCPERTLETDLTFRLKYAKTLLVQRYDNVLGLVKDSFPNQTLSDFVWFHDGDTIKNQHGAVLYMGDESPSGEYRVCYTIHEEGKDIDTCTCPIQIKAPTERHLFDDSNLQITATYNPRGKQVFVNAARNDKDDITCSAEWIDVSGRVLERYDIPSGGGLIDTPVEGGFYLLRVSADGECRSFKMFINY